MKNTLFLFFIISFNCLAQNAEFFLYDQAVKEVQNNSKLKRDTILFNISSSNSRLQTKCSRRWSCARYSDNWEKKGKFKKNIRVKMVSWVSEGIAKKYFIPSVGKRRPYNVGTASLWVTAYPQILNFCQKTDKQNVRLRLEQYLGLPPTGRKTHFVHLWVDPNDLFRPCFDSHISDTKCEYKASRGTKAEHQKWMKNTYKLNFPAQGRGVPWTRLGYTYDWGNPNTYIGASEYVISKNSRVFVESVTPTGIYCAK